MIIPIDFVAGTHGNFLEVFLNCAAGYVDSNFEPFTSLGTSHVRTMAYKEKQVFDARHWFEIWPGELKKHKQVISIQFDPDDLLLVSSISLLRAGDTNINNNDLEIDTVSKLNNQYYQPVLQKIYESYPFLALDDPNIPRYVLREFYKFGFGDPAVNGYWQKQQAMTYAPGCEVFQWHLKNFYDWTLFEINAQAVSRLFGIPMAVNKFQHLHSEFLARVPFLHHKSQCDRIIQNVIDGLDTDLPPLSLFQESYINAILENIFKREMPFHHDNYFKNTKDIVYYINTQAPYL